MAAHDDEEDLYDDEFDFVDDDDEDDDDADDAKDGSELDDDDLEDDDSDLDDSELDSDTSSAVPADDVARDVPREREPDRNAKPAPREVVARRESRDYDHDPRDDGDRGAEPDAEFNEVADEEKVDDLGRPAPLANYVVHIYEYRQFKRTIDRPFTGEDAEAFASEYNRTSKPYGRFAIAGKDDAKPRKLLD